MTIAQKHIDRLRSRAGAAAVVVPILHAGVLLGCSVLATSAKFLAPSLTRPVALDVGRHTFGVLHVVECAFVAFATGLWWYVSGFNRSFKLMLLVLAVLVLEMAWLRPVIDARVTLLMEGVELPTSWHHYGFIALEILKIALLLWLSTANLRNVQRSI